MLITVATKYHRFRDIIARLLLTMNFLRTKDEQSSSVFAVVIQIWETNKKVHTYILYLSSHIRSFIMYTCGTKALLTILIILQTSLLSENGTDELHYTYIHNKYIATMCKACFCNIVCSLDGGWF